MKLIYILFLLISIIGFACKTKPSSYFPTHYESEIKLGNENIIICRYKDANLYSMGVERVMVEGKNNVIEFYYDNVTIINVNGSSGVVLFRGNNNHIIYHIRNINDLSNGNINKIEPIVINLGNNNKVEITIDGEEIVSRPLKKGLKVKEIKKNDVKVKKKNEPSETFKNVIDLNEFSKDTLDKEKEPIYKSNIDTNEVIYYGKLKRNLKINEALKIIQADVDKGEPEAYYVLANIYFNGLAGITRNTSKALLLYEKAATKNYIAAQFALGGIYESGMLDVTQDTQKAILYYKMAAKNGNEQAQNKVKELEGK